MSKFGSLGQAADKPYRVEILSPETEKPIKDKQGRVMYVDVLASDGNTGRAYDKERRSDQRLKAKQSRNGRVPDEDQVEVTKAKLAHLTVAWHLVDPANGEVLDVPCNVDNALELYNLPLMSWIYLQVAVASGEVANFLERPPTSSSTTPEAISETS